ncbi:MAG: amidase family protein [Aquabacterium sp.]|nr:amidase family protein [Aquabacterium sp.]
MKSKQVHAFSDDALGCLDAVGVASAIRSGEITAAETVEAAIRRVEQVNPALNAVELRTYDHARNQSSCLLPNRPFAGVPSFIKDNTDVMGLVTRNGSAAYTSPQPAKKHTPNAAHFLDQGYVLLGKSTTPEYGFLPSTEALPWRPATCNPWNTSRTAGGSSSGSAALVASGAVPRLRSPQPSLFMK